MTNGGELKVFPICFFFEHQEDRGWLTVIEKQGLHQVAEILENNGINSETDVSVLDRDDFCKLVSEGLRPLEAWASF